MASGFYQGGAANLRLGEEFHHNRVRIVASQIAGAPVRPRGRGGTSAGSSARSWLRSSRARSTSTRSSPTSSMPATSPRCSRAWTPATPTVLQAVLRFAGGPGARPVTDRPAHRRLTPPAVPRRPLGAWRSSAAATIAQSAHLPGLREVRRGGHRRLEPDGRDHRDVPERFPFVGRRYDSRRGAARRPRGAGRRHRHRPPERRLTLIEAAVAAGKHVLSQKPLTRRRDDLGGCPRCSSRRASAGIRVAVNQNARWAPAWRLATLLVRDGAVGEVVGVTHLHDKPLPPLAGTPFDDVPHMLLTDYLVHWVDISRTAGSTARPTARASRLGAGDRLPRAGPAGRGAQPVVGDDACSPRAAARPRPSGSSATWSPRRPGCPFWVHGTDGHPARQRAARSRTASSSTTATRAPRRRRSRASGSSTASPARWAS